MIIFFLYLVQFVFRITNSAFTIYMEYNIVGCVRDLQFLRTFSCVYTGNSPLGCKFVYCTSAAFNLKRVPGALFSVSLIKLKSALSRI